MESLLHYVTPPGRCSYLPDQVWQLEYELFASLTPAEYMRRMSQGWRRFGIATFRPQCPHCTACRSLRVPVAQFRPNRSQRRVRAANDGVIEVRVGPPSVSYTKLALYDRYHEFQSDHIGWRGHTPKDAVEYTASFVENPFPVEEWCYYLDGQLIGVGYLDVLPEGFSAIYFFYEPAERERSLGTYNVLRLIDSCRERGVPHLYLGFYVEGCRSLQYKANFTPNEILTTQGTWEAFRE